jgi:hypothetical protein
MAVSAHLEGNLVGVLPLIEDHQNAIQTGRSGTQHHGKAGHSSSSSACDTINPSRPSKGS